MAREQIIWQGGTGRDAGKIFQLTEVSPFKSFEWGMKAANALAGKIPAEYAQSIDGVGAWIRSEGIERLILAEPTLLLPLLEEALAITVRYKNTLDSMTSFAVEWDSDRGYVEERQTLADLLYEVFKLHTNFYSGANL